jgi:hypothetical protein
MGNYIRFGDYLESKEKDMDAKDGLAGEDNDGPLSTHPSQPPSKGARTKPLPYKNVSDDDKKNVVWVANGGDEGEALGDKGTPGLTPQNSASKGEKPVSKIEHPKFSKMTSEGKKPVVLVAKDSDDKNGLGCKATPGLTPKNSASKGEKPVINTEHPKQAKLTSEEFIDKTKDMSPSEFAKFMTENAHQDTQISAITDLYGNEFTPDPTQTIQYLSGLLLGNHVLMERFIREMKRRNGLANMIEEIMGHPETYDSLTDSLQHSDMGEDRCGSLAKSMNSKYMSVLDNIEMESVVNETIDAPPNQRWAGQQGQQQRPQVQRKPGGAFGGGSGLSGAPSPEYQGSVAPKQGGAFGGGSPGAGAQGNQQSPQFADQPPLQPPGNKQAGMRYMGESASNNMIKAMSGYDHMKKKMAEYCKDGNC